MAMNLLVVSLVLLYSIWIIKNRWKKLKTGAGCGGCCSSCRGCNHSSKGCVEEAEIVRQPSVLFVEKKEN